MSQKSYLKNIKDCIKELVNPFPNGIPELKSDGSNAQDFYCADVVGARRFVQNYGGHPRSDIAEINSQATIQAQMNLLNDLNVIPLDDSTSGLTDVQIMMGHKSKYCQAPSEMQDWLVDQITYRDIQRSNGGSKTEPKDSVEFNDGDANTTDVNE